MQQFTATDTERYSEEDLKTLNQIYEHRVDLLDADNYKDENLLLRIRGQVLSDYSDARDLVHDYVLERGGEPIPIEAIRDLRIAGNGDEPAVVALVDIIYDDGSRIRDLLVVCYTDGGQITQGDWQCPSREIPEDLAEMRWQHAPSGNSAIICGDGLPRYIALW